MQCANRRVRTSPVSVLLVITILIATTHVAQASRTSVARKDSEQLSADEGPSAQMLPGALPNDKIEEAPRAVVATLLDGMYRSNLAMMILIVPFLVIIAKQSLTGSHTMVLLIIPFVTAAATLSLTIAQGTSSCLVSDALNYWDWEPWSFWVIRYGLWHATFAGVFLFKLKVFPAKIQWLAVLNLVACLATIWSGFSQVSRAGDHWRWDVHWVSAMVLAVTWAVETPSLWAQGNMRAAYVLLILSYVLTFLFAEYGITPDTGIPLIGRRIGIPVQWAMFALHLVLIHENYPRVWEEGFSSRLLGLDPKGEPAGDFSLDLQH